MSKIDAELKYILGLDIGTSSVSWAVLRIEQSDMVGIHALGSRVFEAGVAGFGTSKEASRASSRRMARGLRRQVMRRRQRRILVYRWLARHDLLPRVDGADRVAVRMALDQLDRELRSRHCPFGDDLAQQTLPYRLRARGLEERLLPLELGRALFHLGQRRGFRSNRRTDRREGSAGAGTAEQDERDLGVVKAGISDLRKAMDEAGASTLGAYFARINPHHERIRARYADRGMFQEEFDQLRARQAPLHPDLDANFWDVLRERIFRQRNLRSSKHLVGRCDLEPRRPRAPALSELAQRARLLQGVNHLRLAIRDEPERPLTPDERRDLIGLLETQASMTWPAVAKCLGLKFKDVKFNLDRGGQPRLDGHVVAAQLRPIMGEQRWDGWSAEVRDALARRVEHTESPEVLRRIAKDVYALDDQGCEAIADVRLPQAYARFSSRALRKIVPYLEQGLSMTEAQDAAYPARRTTAEVKDRVPPLHKSLPGLRNPIVSRSLTEVRKVVNELIERFGKPDQIRIELARDLKQGKRARDEVAKRNRAQQKVREAAQQRILANIPGLTVRSIDIQKLLLAEECKWTCPYTGRSFGMRDLFGSTPTVDIEHIVPFSRCLDDSFANKTLCMVEENRNVKRNRTPFEAYSRDAEKFREILARVKDFQPSHATRRTKLERFRAASDGELDLDEFVNRQLVDTAYAARLTADLLAPLYGGDVDKDGRRRIQRTSGRVTALLRRQWGTETLLRTDGGQGKSRDDHRHHALDAAVVAATSPAMVTRLSDAAANAERQHLRRNLAEIAPPFAGFRDELQKRLRPIVVSHRVDRRLNGSLHEDTLYQMRKGDKRGWTRTKVEKIEEKHLEGLPDPVLRERLRAWIAQGKPTPRLEVVGKQGTQRIVRRVRLRASRGNLLSVGEGHRRRYVAPGSNHHMEVFQVLGSTGGFFTRLVNRLEAMNRHRRGLPIVDRVGGENHVFLFSLHSGDCIGRPYGPGWDVLRISSVTETQWDGVAASDARPSRDVRKGGVSGGRVAGSPQGLLKQGYVKVDVSPTGLVRRNHE